jgi:hypothetical protein
MSKITIRTNTLRMFGNEFFKRILGIIGEEITSQWR